MEKNFEKYSNKNGTIYHGDALDILSSNKHSKNLFKRVCVFLVTMPSGSSDSSSRLVSLWLQEVLE